MALDPQLEPHFEEAARLNNVDPMLLRALAMGESSGRPNVTSEAGAGGLMQIMPDTAKRYGIKDPYDPVQAIYGGAEILNDALTKAEQQRQSGRNINPVDHALRTYFAGDEGPDWGPKTAAYPGYIAGKYVQLQNSARTRNGIDQLAAAGDPGAAARNPIAVQPLSNNATVPPGVAQLAAAGGNPRTGGVPAGTPGAWPAITPAAAQQANAAALANGESHLPVMPSSYIFGKGLVAPPGAGSVSGNPQIAQATPGAVDMSAVPKAPPGTALSVPGMPGTPQTAQAAPLPSDEELLQGLQRIAPMLTGAPSASGAPAAATQAAPGGTVPPGVAALAQAGGAQINPAYIAEAQRRANMNAALGRQTPGYLNEAAALPFAGPKAAEEGWGRAPSQVAVARATPHPMRPGSVLGDANGPIYGAPTIEEFQNPDGSKYRAVVDPISGRIQAVVGAPSQPAGGAQAQQPGAAGTTGALPPQGGQPPASAGQQAAVSAIGPGQHQALVTRAEKEQADRHQVITEANLAQQSRATLMNMQNETPDFYRGAGAERLQGLARYFRIIDPSWNGQVASYEDFVKNAGALTRTAVREVSSRAAVQEFNLIQNSLPNPELSPIGLRRVQNEMIGLTDFRLAKAQAQQQWEDQHGGPGNVTGFETWFQRQASPYAFIVAAMHGDDRKEMYAKLQGSTDGRRELSRLGEQLTFLKKSGLAQ